MAQLFKFFNSAPGDPRTYQAADFADYFGTVLKNGIIAVDGDMGLQVTHDTGLTVNVAPGKSILRGHLYENTAIEPLELSIPEVTLDRIDRIVLRLDSSIGERNILLAVKQGESSLTPEPPELTRTSFVYEISLAQIFLERNTASIGTITDERLNEDLAGAVKVTNTVDSILFKDVITGITGKPEVTDTPKITLEQAVSEIDFNAHLAEDTPHENAECLKASEEIRVTSTKNATSEIDAPLRSDGGGAVAKDFFIGGIYQANKQGVIFSNRLLTEIYYDDGKGNLDGNRQIRIKIQGASGHSYNIQLNFSSYGAGATMKLIDKLFLFALSNNVFLSKETNERANIGFSSDDVDIIPAGENNRFEIIIKNTSPNFLDKWMLNIIIRGTRNITEGGILEFEIEDIPE